MTVTELTSKDNPLFKRIRLVASQARSAPRNLVLAEGLRSLEEAAAAGCTIESVLCTERFGSLRRGAALLATLSGQATRLYQVSDRLLKSVSEVQTPQGLLGLVHVPVITLEDWVSVPCPLILCACEIQDPGNLGTLIRTAAAAGVSLVCTISGTVSARNPKAIRASAGAFFRLPVVEHVSISKFLAYCRAHRITSYLADVHGKKPYTSVDYTCGSAILLGNEGRGIAGPIWAQIESIRIPMAPGVESLNVGSAGALVVFEAFRQRTASGEGLSLD